MIAACQNGHRDIVLLLLGYKNILESKSGKNDIGGGTPLLAACINGHRDIVLLLLGHKNLLVNKSGKKGASPLLLACQEGDDEVVSTLLTQNSVEIDKCMFTGMSSLYIAFMLGHTKIVQILLSRRADSDICMRKMEYVKNAFYSEFYDRCININQSPDYHVSAFQKCIRYVIKDLVSNNTKENVKSHIDNMTEDWVFILMFGTSPLHMASVMGHTDVVKL